MTKIEGLNLKINKFFRIKFSNARRNKIINDDFTIISNNCWGGMIYESYNLEKKTPTVGLFFTSKDYLKFISNLKYYLSLKLEFIDYNNSKNIDFLAENDIKKNIIIGVLDDIEIYFLHYKNPEEAFDKWERRKKRINYQKIIFKFNDQNGCNLDDLNTFLNLPYKNKIFFTVKNWKINNQSIIKIFQLINKKYILASHEPFGNNIQFNVNKFINYLSTEDYFNDI